MVYNEKEETLDASRLVAEGMPAVRRFVLEVAEGPDKGKTFRGDSGRVSVGTHPSNEAVLTDRTVSRFHCEVVVESGEPWIRDLKSKNGTMVDGMFVREALLKEGAAIRVADSTLHFQLVGDTAPMPVSEKEKFGLLVGCSLPMRAAFHVLERAAATDATVLIEGETGTGKDAAAESVHSLSRRSQQPFIVVDCGSIAANLIESKLFGHEKGSFTGAVAQHIGAFEAAHGGTVFLDELGELPTDLQPKLLRVLEQRTIERVGSNQRRPVDVRVVAATNRHLREAVNAGTFRSDLYFRLAVINVRMPPLRERPEDIPLLVQVILSTLGAKASEIQRLSTPEFFARLQSAAWPGNVRELRNYLEQCLVLLQPPPLQRGAQSSAQVENFDERPSYELARQSAVDAFERRYLEWLLMRHGANISEAARQVGISRRHLYRLRERHGL